jgi:hypothetical protein
MALLGLVAGLAVGDEGQPSLQQFADRMRENQTRVRQYHFTERVLFVVDGTPEAPRLNRVRFDRAGDLRRTALGHEVKAPEVSDRARGLLDRQIVADETETDAASDAEDRLARMIALIDEYALLGPGRAQAIFSRAALVEDDEAGPDLLHYRVDDVSGAGDRLDLWMDDDSLAPRRIVVATFLEQDPATVTLEFTELPDGPLVSGRSTVELSTPDASVSLRTEWFDFVRQDL